MRPLRTIRQLLVAAGAVVVASGGCGKSGSAANDGAAGGTLTGGAAGSGAGGSTGGSAALSSIIPDERLIDWTVAGVPGGIPHSTSICATVVDSTKLQAAIDGCPPGGVVYVPAGVYKLGSGIVNASHSGIVVRGDGPGKTVFQAGATATAFNFGNADWPPPAATIPVSAGATKNSSTVTVDSTGATASHAAFQVGWNVHTLAYVLMIAVIVSGFYGVSAYVRIPTRITSTLGDDTLESLLLGIADLDRALRPMALGLPDTVNRLVLASAQETRIGGTWRQQIRGLDSDCPTAAAVTGLQAIGKSLRGEEARANEQVYALMARKQELVNRARRAVALKARLDLWLFIHVPLSIALIAALVAHVVSVFFYW